MKFAILLLSALCASQASLLTPLQRSEIAKPRADGIDYRLPRMADPEHYVITLEPDFDQFTFDGEVFVDFTAISDAYNVTLHVFDITVRTVVLFDENLNSVTVNVFEFDSQLDFLIVHLGESLRIGEKYTLHVTYLGNLNRDKSGFYRSSYEDVNGNTRWLALTQFEPCDARRAFPSFDEPDLKATFQINLIRNSSYNSIANTDLAETIQLGINRFMDVFTTTTRMSTYLVAFVVSDFTYTESVANNHRVFARPQYIANGDANFALEMGIVALERMGEFLDNSYFDHMPKMDQIGLPDKDFAAGAMENWGLVTYRDQFVHSAVHSGFSVDGLETTRPMTFDAGSPSEISALFDNIAYSKSGAVIRMLEHIVTPANFVAGLKWYLEKQAYTGVDSSSLWYSMQSTLPPAGEEGYINIEEVMHSWELQAGMPVVTVSRSYETGDITLEQERFLLYKATHNDTTEWFVPITYSTSADLAFSNTRPSGWLVPGENLNVAVGLENLSPTDWIIVNNQQTGYYRVNYDEANWLLISAYLSSSNVMNIHTFNRGQLIDDSFYLAFSGRLSYRIPLEISKYISRETEYLPLLEFFNFLGYINDRILGISNYNDFKKIVGTYLLTDVFNNFGTTETPEDKHADILIRDDVMRWACYMDNDACKTVTSNMVRAWIEDSVTNPLSVDTQREVLCGGLRSDVSGTLWNEVYEKYLQLAPSTLKSDTLNALGCTENVDQLNNFFEIALADSTNSLRNVFDLVYSKGKTNLDTAFDFVINNYDRISETWSASIAKSILEKICNLLGSAEDLAKMESFMATHPELDFQIALNNILRNNKWLEDFGADIESWIQNNMQ